ncbi:hypothetical protein L195_g049148, partial [Trifolium pratense]
AICCAAKAGLHVPSVENIAPASAVPAMEGSFGEFEVLFKHFVLIMVIAITVDDAIDELMAK